MQTNEHTGHILADFISAIAILGHLVSVYFFPFLSAFFPALAAFAGCVWYCLQIYDWIKKRKEKKERLARHESVHGPPQHRDAHNGQDWPEDGS